MVPGYDKWCKDGEEEEKEKEKEEEDDDEEEEKEKEQKEKEEGEQLAGDSIIVLFSFRCPFLLSSASCAFILSFYFFNICSSFRVSLCAFLRYARCCF